MAICLALEQENLFKTTNTYKLCSFVGSGPNSNYCWVTLSKRVPLRLVSRMRLIDCTLDPSQRKLPSCQRLVWIWHWQYGPKLQRFPLIVSLLHWQKTLDCCRLVKYSILLVYLVQLREFYGRQTLECELKAFKNILVPNISRITAGQNYISSLGVVDCLYSNFCSTVPVSLYNNFKLHEEYIVGTNSTNPVL